MIPGLTASHTVISEALIQELNIISAAMTNGNLICCKRRDGSKCRKFDYLANISDVDDPWIVVDHQSCLECPGLESP